MKRMCLDLLKIARKVRIDLTMFYDTNKLMVSVHFPNVTNIQREEKKFNHGKERTKQCN